ncbi:MAG: maleylpyruvate isomerase N-terminal domain-containing protein [Candidatus Rokubacteria bacterium]|nr:maleylpyruvate isomerase N-terminal domain-containing protein [Candidatus Rokubacteria bacterium]
MTVDRSYVALNETQRQRLSALVRRLSDAELGRALAAGWTVAGVLGHLAFWDERILVLLERWQREGGSAVPPPLDHGAVDWINDAAKPLLLSLPPRRVAALAVAIAEAVDREVAALPDELVARNAAAGNPVNLLRAEHRREHLDEIERTLGG